MKLLIRFEIPYFSFMPLSFFFPAATWSPCRSRKLLAVDAAFRASVDDTDDGSWWNELAVRRASFFCAVVVPSVGVAAAEWSGDDDDILENLPCNSLS